MNDTNSIIESIGILFALLGILFAAHQLQRTREIARSTLSITLMEKAWGFTEIHDKIQLGHPISGKDEYKWKARDFLRYLETTMLLVSDGTISSDQLFPAIGYRTLVFMNDRFIMDTFLIETGNGTDKPAQPSRRHCGAFALYEIFFTHLLVSHKDDLKDALEHYGMPVEGKSRNGSSLATSLFQKPEFVLGVQTYYIKRHWIMAKTVPGKIQSQRDRLKIEFGI